MFYFNKKCNVFGIIIALGNHCVIAGKKKDICLLRYFVFTYFAFIIFIYSIFTYNHLFTKFGIKINGF